MAVTRRTALLVGWMCLVLCQITVAAPVSSNVLIQNVLNALRAQSGTSVRARCVLQVNSDLADDIKVNNQVSGTLDFEQSSLGGNLRVSGTVSGIDPTSADLHGFHVHSSSDMSNGCTSTGGHFNPFGKNHGAPSDVERHVGDFGNVYQYHGNVDVSIQDHLASLVGDNSIIGKAIVLHKERDDLGTGGYSDSLTTGHAGARLACCEIVAV
ncbi:superoxide dismutase [Cu-Zn]-like [Asterias rubens]|uniref:superoxide dismutase [Cu-Zn]-like n=1 Tax=Asterias rubens TaxID=7604 RepID=UPI000FECE035|nr:superoxide dismutase [Cu-Zn]-like [Asterias rubens]